MSLDAFEILLEMENDCRTHSRPLPRQKDIGKNWQGIGFITLNYHCVVPIDEVKEILTVPVQTPLPASASWFKGVANLRGHPLPITDLQGFLIGGEQSEPRSALETPHSRILVVDFNKSDVGFLVQQVLGVQRFLEKTLMPLEKITVEEIDQKFKPFLKGAFKEENTLWYILSLKSITETAEFYRIAKEVGG